MITGSRRRDRTRRSVGTRFIAVVFALGAFGYGLSQGQNKANKLNPFTGNADAIKEGRALYIQLGCSGCHGLGGGGGMGPPLIDDEWKFGSNDETLFKLIKGEVAESTMPKVWAGLDNDQVWKIIAYIRSVYQGDPARVDW